LNGDAPSVTETHLTASYLDKLKALDSCTVSNAIERLEVRLRNEGFIVDAVKCRFPDLPSMVGYAATARIRTAAPPMTGHRCYYDRMDWWRYVASLPVPRVLVLEDMDQRPGIGAFVGEIHAAMSLALECAGCVTNGAVRDLNQIESLRFPLFSGSVSVSHSYAHIIEFGEPVEIGGLKIQSGDLLHGDLNGVQTIPLQVAPSVVAAAAKVLEDEKALIDFCRSSQFSLDELEQRLEKCAARCDVPWRNS
jgi:4-hydroxy-4-methyl-2-oxoglutarate aldolase